jgi:SnoaL-like protein
MAVRDEIENLYALYAWAFDMDQLELLADMFTDDAKVEFSNGQAEGREEVLADLEKRRAIFRRDSLVPWHLMTNLHIVRATEREATVRCFYTFFVKQPSGSIDPNRIGYYEDVFVEQAGVWRIRRRRIVSGGRPATETVPDGATPGRQTR